MTGALNVDTPHALLDKLSVELKAVDADQKNAYVALNAARDAYHLREWIWHAHLDGNSAMQNSVMGKSGAECDWNSWINSQFQSFPILQEICNGSKHFKLDRSENITQTHESGWDMQTWDTLPWDSEGFYVELTDGSVVSVTELLKDAYHFWKNLFKTHSL